MRSILLYEDNHDLREGVSGLLHLIPEYKLAGAFADCGQVEEQVRNFNPDMILMDIDMPGITGIEAVKKIRAFNKTVLIMMLTVFDDTAHVFDAVCSGADGYLLKKHIAESLVQAMYDLSGGGAPMSPAIARMVIKGMQQQTNSKYNLTPRETEILTLLSQGNSFKMIAAALNLSFETVKTHIKHIYEKLQVSSQLEAVSKALNEKLV